MGASIAGKPPICITYSYAAYLGKNIEELHYDYYSRLLSIRFTPPPTQGASYHQVYYIFSDGNPNRNHFLPLESWVGDRPNLSINHQFDVHIIHRCPEQCGITWIIMLFTQGSQTQSANPRPEVNIGFFGHLCVRKLRLQGDAHSTQANPISAKFWERLRFLVGNPHLLSILNEDFPGSNHFRTSKMPKMCGAQRHSEPMTLEAVN